MLSLTGLEPVLSASQADVLPLTLQRLIVLLNNTVPAGLEPAT